MRIEFRMVRLYCIKHNNKNNLLRHNIHKPMHKY